MTAISIKAFRGQVPRVSERLLQGNQAVAALNCKITSGRLDPLRGPGLVLTSPLDPVTTLYRHSFQGAENWLVWSRTVDVARSPSSQDPLGRLYWTGDGEPRMASTADAVNGAGPYPATFYVLGIPKPTAAASIVVTGGAGANVDRAYVYRYKNQYNELSGPSPTTLKTGKVDGSWDLSGMSVVPPNSGTISNAVADTPAPGFVEVTLDATFGLFAHEEIVFAGVTGMTDLNGTFAITSVDSGSNKVVVPLTTAQTYSAGADTWARKAPHNTANMKKWIYRTEGTNTDFKFVAEIAATAATYSDTVASTALGESFGAQVEPPPKNGHSTGNLANGALYMLAGNELCLSEQNKPYSWPTSNRYAFGGEGVAAFSVENAIIVLTDGYPIVAIASVPEAASLSRLPGEAHAPCVSKRGAQDTGSGCLFPSHDGLWEATLSGARNVTKGLFRHDEWNELLPATFDAAIFDQRYYAMHSRADGGSGRLLVLDMVEPDSITETDDEFTALYANPWDGRMYVAKGSRIYEWDADDSNRYLAFWQSRDYQLGAPVNFSAAQVHARYGDIVPLDTTILDFNTNLLANPELVNGAICSAPINKHAINGSALRRVRQATTRAVQFSLVRDGEVVFTKALTSSKPFRLPGGFKSDVYAVQISSSVPVYSIGVAQGMEELKAASQ